MNELQQLLAQIDQLKIELDNLRPMSKEHYTRYINKLHLDWNYHSNSIEGNTLTLSETRALLLYGNTAKGKPLRHHLEMRGHNEALKQLENIVHKDVKITESLIKDLHRTILVEPYEEPGVEINPGHWKTVPNYILLDFNVETGEQRLDFTPPNDVPQAMNELVTWLNNHIYAGELKYYNRKHYNLHPLLIAATFHWRFIRIHPFGDGNGRMARILMNLILMQTGFVPVIINLETKKDYYKVLNESTLDNVIPFAEYVGEKLVAGLDLAIKAAKGEAIEEPEDWMKQVELLQREVDSENKNTLLTEQSISNQQNIMNKVFIPLLEELNKRLIVLGNTLFKVGEWCFWKKEENTQKKGCYSSSFKNIISVLKERSRQKEFERKELQILFSLEQFKNLKKKFDVACIFDLEFEKIQYVLKFDVSNESIYNPLAHLLDSNLKKMKKFSGENVPDYSLTFGNTPYNIIPSEEIIKNEWCNKIFDKIISYIKYEQDKEED